MDKKGSEFRLEHHLEVLMALGEMVWIQFAFKHSSLPLLQRVGGRRIRYRSLLIVGTG